MPTCRGCARSVSYTHLDVYKRQEVEREAFARGERARQLKVSLSERERELETLRVELTDRDRRLSSMEQQTPSSSELRHLQLELTSARKRIDDLLAETNRRTQQDDEVEMCIRDRRSTGRPRRKLGGVGRKAGPRRSYRK